MSDNNVCPYCNGYETTAGFMHEARCPMNRTTTTYYTVPLADLQAEIARLKAELEQAESVLAGMETNRNYWVRKCWAIKLYRLARQLDKLLWRINDPLVVYMSEIDFPEGWPEDAE